VSGWLPLNCYALCPASVHRLQGTRTLRINHPAVAASKFLTLTYEDASCVFRTLPTCSGCFSRVQDASHVFTYSDVEDTLRVLGYFSRVQDTSQEFFMSSGHFSCIQDTSHMFRTLPTCSGRFPRVQDASHVFRTPLMYSEDIFHVLGCFSRVQDTSHEFRTLFMCSGHFSHVQDASHAFRTHLTCSGHFTQSYAPCMWTLIQDR
jgi:hypothetical protein